MARIIGVLSLAGALAACSTIKLAYNNLPEVGYWWLDGYLDFDAAQAPRVRDELQQLLAWHRRSELPKIVGLLQQAQALASEDLTPEQACEVFDAARQRLLAVAERAEPAGAELALGLSDAQLQHLERKYDKLNADYRKEWLERSPAGQQERRYTQMLERSEDFYGRLDADQRDLLRELLSRSVFDPREIDAERRQRQQDALALLRRFQAAKPAPAEAQAAIHAYLLRIAEPPPGAWRERQQSLQQEGCRNLATLHNQTTVAQRERAARRLQGYASDLRQLASAR